MEEQSMEELSNGSGSAGGAGLAIASMVLGIVSLVLCCFTGISVPCAIISIIMAGVVLRKHMNGKGMAIAGMVCSIVAIVLLLFASIFGYSLAALDTIFTNALGF